MRRIVWNHDGMTDLWLEAIPMATPTRKTTILELTIPFLLQEQEDPPETTSWRRTSHWEFWIQRGSFRITFLTSDTIVLTNPQEGVLQMFIPLPDRDPDSNFRMRVLVEQVDPKRPSGQNKSYFATLASEDFFQPLQQFLVVQSNESPTSQEQAPNNALERNEQVES